eukprot:COSAG02_NODE_26094_length_641_cov_0.852399_2_plen_105_part_01
MEALGQQVAETREAVDIQAAAAIQMTVMNPATPAVNAQAEDEPGNALNSLNSPASMTMASELSTATNLDASQDPKSAVWRIEAPAVASDEDRQAAIDFFKQKTAY